MGVLSGTLQYCGLGFMLHVFLGRGAAELCEVQFSGDCDVSGPVLDSELNLEVESSDVASSCNKRK